MVNKKDTYRTSGKKIRILVVDDHPIVRQGLAQLIEEEPDLEVCAQAEDAPEAMLLIKELQPDFIIVDLSLKETSGMELIKGIQIFPFLLSRCMMNCSMPNVRFELAPKGM